MLWVLLPLVAGIAIDQSIDCSYIAAIVILSISAVVALLSRSSLGIALMVLGFGMTLSSLHVEEELMVSAREWAIKIEGRNNSELVAYRHEGGEWSRCSGMVWVNGLNGIEIDQSEVLICHGKLKSLSDSPNKFERSIAKRGYSGLLYVEHISGVDASLFEPSFTSRMRRWVGSRLDRLELGGDIEAMVKALMLGDRTALSPQIRASYARSGTAHLLALSGLHLGIIVVIFSSLLVWVPLLGRGEMLRSIALIVLVWAFAALTGFSSSIVRAAFMFSTLQLSLSISRSYNSLNTLCFVAVVMIIVDWGVIYDLGFQLSFISVAAILLWALPLYRRLESGWWIVDSIVGTAIFGVVATLASAPIVAYTFGEVSILSPLSTLGMMLTLGISIALLMIWIIAPLPPLRGLVEQAVEICLTVQNYLAEWFSDWGWGVLKLDISHFDMWLAYIFYVGATIILYRTLGSKEPNRLPLRRI